MDQAIQQREKLELRKNRKRSRNFQSDVDIILLMSTINVRICFLAQYLMSQVHRPIKKPTTSLGNQYIQNVLTEDREHFRSLYRMYPEVFLKLCTIIRQKTSLRDTRWVSVEEMLATFLLIVGQSSRYIIPKDVFKRSSFTISQSFNKILKVLNTIGPTWMIKPGNVVPSRIRESTRFYPYFKVCKKLFFPTVSFVQFY